MPTDWKCVGCTLWMNHGSTSCTEPSEWRCWWRSKVVNTSWGNWYWCYFFWFLSAPQPKKKNLNQYRFLGSSAQFPADFKSLGVILSNSWSFQCRHPFCMLPIVSKNVSLSLSLMSVFVFFTPNRTEPIWRTRRCREHWDTTTSWISSGRSLDSDFYSGSAHSGFTPSLKTHFHCNL